MGNYGCFWSLRPCAARLLNGGPLVGLISFDPGFFWVWCRRFVDTPKNIDLLNNYPLPNFFSIFRSPSRLDLLVFLCSLPSSVLLRDGCKAVFSVPSIPFFFHCLFHASRVFFRTPWYDVAVSTSSARLVYEVPLTRMCL